MIGAEGRRNESTVSETAFSFLGQIPSAPMLFGGRETTGALFGQVKFVASDRLAVVLGARGDLWDSEPRDPADATKSANFFSPRASVTFQATSDVLIRVSAYRAHRTPTLNELHRGFRVGNVVTNPNKLLEPESLTGIEGGILLQNARGSARISGFWNRLSDAVANVTVLVSPNLITRERQNARAVRSAGVELEGEYRPHPSVALTALAVFTEVVFVETVQSGLDGNRIPQVPEYQFSAGVRFVDPRLFSLSMQLRYIGPQFEDDLNAINLGRASTVDLYASRSLGSGVHAFFAVENLFDDEYDVGNTGVRTVGMPVTVRGGVRLFLP